MVYYRSHMEDDYHDYNTYEENVLKIKIICFLLFLFSYVIFHVTSLTYLSNVLHEQYELLDKTKELLKLVNNTIV